MKILKTSLVVTGLLAAAAFQSEAKAENEFYLAPEVAYVLPTDGDVDDTVFVGARAGLNLNESWSAEVESGWMEYGWDATDNVTNIDITTVPVLLNLRYNERCSEDEMGWYAFGGAGWAFNDLEDNDADVDTDDSFAWQAGVGLVAPVAKGVDAFIDARYLWNRADLDAPAAVKAVTSDDVDLSSVLFTAGLKF